MSWNISNPDTIGVGLYNCINYAVLVQKFKPFLTMATPNVGAIFYGLSLYLYIVPA